MSPGASGPSRIQKAGEATTASHGRVATRSQKTTIHRQVLQLHEGGTP
jgi:hypothetical protein